MVDVAISFAKNIFSNNPIWQDGILMRPDLAPGTSEWLNGQDGKIAALNYVCPCGCGTVGCVPVKIGIAKDSWNWDGNLLKPTLTPSIQKHSPCRWHGYLTAGVFKNV
jgi:uncharacterized protein DUF6527